jgi:hypothetical protein
VKYVCPDCDSEMELCTPFVDDKPLLLNRNLRSSRSEDEFGSSPSGSDPAYVCWACSCVRPRSACYVNHRKPTGKAAAAGDS